MSWAFGNWYRVRVVNNNVVIKRIPTTGTALVEVMLEVYDGEQAQQRARYTGFLNTPENAARARKDLLAMGWKGSRWGDWSGLFGGKYLRRV